MRRIFDLYESRFRRHKNRIRYQRGLRSGSLNTALEKISVSDIRSNRYHDGHAPSAVPNTDIGLYIDPLAVRLYSVVVAQPMADTMAGSRAAALEQQLQDRPSPDHLERRGIMKPGGNIADARSALERNMTKALVGRQVAARPEYADLVQANIAYDTSLAPSLQAQARALERNIRCDQLNAALSNRQAPEHIMPADHVAPRLRSAQIALEQALARDQLKRKLDNRPTVDVLLKNNILKAPPTVAPSLQATQVELEKQLRLDRMNEFLSGRSALDDTVAASLQGTQKDLQRNLARSNLYHALQARPSPELMCQSGLLHQEVAQPASAVGLALGPSHDDSPYDARPRSFVLSRALLKLIALMCEAGDVSPAQKGALKDLVVDQDPAILAAADMFDADADLDEFKDTLLRLCRRF